MRELAKQFSAGSQLDQTGKKTQRVRINFGVDVPVFIDQRWHDRPSLHHYYNDLNDFPEAAGENLEERKSKFYLQTPVCI